MSRGAAALLAEGVGFEPTVRARRTTVFETVPFNRSGTPPGLVTPAGFYGPTPRRTERRGWDSNPRGGLTPPTRFPIALLKPLGHLSGHPTGYWLLSRGGPRRTS